MRLVTFRVSTPVGPAIRLGALLDNRTDDRIVDLTAGFAAYLGNETNEPTPRELAQLRVPPDMTGWLRASHAGFKAAEETLAYVRAYPAARGLDGETLVYTRADVALMAPLPRPHSFRDFSIYEEHMSRGHLDPTNPGGPKYSKRPAWYRAPPYYKGSCSSIAGPEDPIPWPYYTKRLDAELELGIIVGKTGRNLTVEQAKDYIAGYTIIVDSSCRDGYEREPFGPTKRKDFHTAVGPWLVTPDELDVETLDCSVSIGGDICFQGNTSAPHSFTPAQLVAYASDNETLYPGDLLGTGTVSYGCSMDHHRWVKVGETMTFIVDGLGAMSLKVVQADAPVRHVDGMEPLVTPPAAKPAA
jgi:2-keto-4-pentenoate hydratase/2-oxohepta-3-ene-1,7-dioic acid hydratase in catechol pathway